MCFSRQKRGFRHWANAKVADRIRPMGTKEVFRGAIQTFGGAARRLRDMQSGVFQGFSKVRPVWMRDIRKKKRQNHLIKKKKNCLVRL